jgi:hypothetical protein
MDLIEEVKDKNPLDPLPASLRVAEAAGKGEKNGSGEKE